MDAVVSVFQAFLNWFTVGGQNLVSLITGILPMLAVLMTFVTALVKFIGEERVTKFMQKCTKTRIARYTILPFLSLFVLTNPMHFTMGVFLPEKYKASFFDACCPLSHALTGLFPHLNSGELFIWLGIASGVQQLGYEVTTLAVCYALVGFVVSFVRASLTERTWAYYAKKNSLAAEQATE